MSLHLLGLTSTAEAATSCAERFGGRAWVAHPTQKPGGPYAGMFEIATDDVEAARSTADIGLHLTFPRVIKELSVAPQAMPERAIASFGMVRNDAMSHREADDHWRDIHGPLALRCHSAMSDYEQFSVLETLSGEPLDGMAMCAFPDRQMLRDRFFDDDAARQAVFDDVSTFANPRGSLPRVVLTQAR